MSTKRIILQFVIAILFAGVASYAATKWLESRGDVPAQAAQIETVQAAVAVAPIPAGTVIESGMIKTMDFLPGTLPRDCFNDCAKLVGRVTVAAVGEKEIFTESRLASSEVKVGGVGALITPGKRAMAVKGNKVLGMSGFVRPGDSLDVLVSMKSSGKTKPFTKVVLENLKVLATGSELVPGEDGKKPSPVDVYTLEVTPQEGERLALAATQGELHFALRHTTDSETVLTEGADEIKTLAAYRPEAKKSTPFKPVRKKGYRVIVFKGNEAKTIWLK